MWTDWCGAMVLVLFSYAGAHGLFLALHAVGSGCVLYVKMGLTAVALIGMAYLLGVRPADKAGMPASHDAAFSISTLIAQDRWGSLLFGVFAFPFLWGFTAQLCDVAGVSNGLFDIATEVVGIVFLAACALAELPRRRAIDPETLFAVVLPVFATAMLLFPLFWGNEVFVAGFVMKCGFLVYTPLMWVCVCGECARGASARDSSSNGAADGGPQGLRLRRGGAVWERPALPRSFELACVEGHAQPRYRAGLFSRAKAWARAAGAGKPCISARSVVESQAFYRAMGCVEAQVYNERDVAAEPFDCQLGRAP